MYPWGRTVYHLSLAVIHCLPYYCIYLNHPLSIPRILIHLLIMTLNLLQPRHLNSYLQLSIEQDFITSIVQLIASEP